MPYKLEPVISSLFVAAFDLFFFHDDIKRIISPVTLSHS